MNCLFESAKYRLACGDCRVLMRDLESDSISAIVTDPPYEIGFMGRSWDSSGIAYDPVVWSECFRVLKPGGHVLAFGGARTFHRLVCAIEDAGFEVRDMLEWVYGSGFPKSRNVAKDIDRARVEDIEPVRAICRIVRGAMDRKGLKSRDLVESFGGCHPRLIDHWAARDTDSQPSLPTWDQWQVLKAILEIDGVDDEVWRLNGRKGKPGEAYENAEVIGKHEGHTPGFVSMRFSSRDDTIRKSSEAARAWSGWGTGLKPAHEPISLARKPFRSTVAANVLERGTGAINVEACKVSNRWPANLMHDGSDEVLDVLGASARFFYCPKASKKDRGEWNTHPTVKPTELMRYLVRLIAPPGGIVLDPFLGSGTTGKACRLEGVEFVGFEEDERHFAIAERRVREATS